LRHLNYSHLHYFWAVAREGSIVAAAEVLHITPQTISGQLKLLEEAIGGELFKRVGRRLELTELGHGVFQYADEIFSIGAELANFVRGQTPMGPISLRVGVVNSMPKLIVERLLAPALHSDEHLRLSCQQASLEQLLGDLATHQLDLVLSDQPMAPGASLRTYNHRLGESGLSFFVRRGDARKYKGRFPASLSDAPMLLPARNTALRRRLEQWFDELDLLPLVVGEFDDSALMKAFGEAGLGIFVGPSAIEEEICAMYHAAVIGRTTDITEHYYAISSERRIQHPAVLNITETARTDLFDS
jgi:LysR family transcriptional activator of nhaA